MLHSAWRGNFLTWPARWVLRQGLNSSNWLRLSLAMGIYMDHVLPPILQRNKGWTGIKKHLQQRLRDLCSSACQGEEAKSCYLKYCLLFVKDIQQTLLEVQMKKKTPNLQIKLATLPLVWGGALHNFSSPHFTVRSLRSEHMDFSSLLRPSSCSNSNYRNGTESRPRRSRLGVRSSPIASPHNRLYRQALHWVPNHFHFVVKIIIDGHELETTNPSCHQCNSRSCWQKAWKESWTAREERRLGRISMIPKILIKQNLICRDL